SVCDMFPTSIPAAQLHIIHQAIPLHIINLNPYFNQQRITIPFLPTHLSHHFISIHNHSLPYLLTAPHNLKHLNPLPYQLLNNYPPTENTLLPTSPIIDPEQ
ncbi:hypothetical protein, partial [Bacillus sp. WP8]|uniref:hypothetical protein n=1 Tax=Bacillus sp. WP8 TaxID=756828 RepID=UPI001C92CA7B